MMVVLELYHRAWTLYFLSLAMDTTDSSTLLFLSSFSSSLLSPSPINWIVYMAFKDKYLHILLWDKEKLIGPHDIILISLELYLKWSSLIFFWLKLYELQCTKIITKWNVRKGKFFMYMFSHKMTAVNIKIGSNIENEKSWHWNILKEA